MSFFCGTESKFSLSSFTPECMQYPFPFLSRVRGQGQRSNGWERCSVWDLVFIKEQHLCVSVEPLSVGYDLGQGVLHILPRHFEEVRTNPNILFPKFTFWLFLIVFCVKTKLLRWSTGTGQCRRRFPIAPQDCYIAIMSVVLLLLAPQAVLQSFICSMQPVGVWICCDSHQESCVFLPLLSDHNTQHSFKEYSFLFKKKRKKI